MIDEIGDSVLINVPSEGFLIDVLPEAGISTSSWQAALNSGVINRLDNRKLSQLTKIYQWIEKDFGLDELAIFQTAIDATDVYDDYDSFVTIYKKTVRIQEWKHRMIREIYQEMEW